MTSTSKKHISIILSAALLCSVTLISGCSSKESTKNPTAISVRTSSEETPVQSSSVGSTSTQNSSVPQSSSAASSTESTVSSVPQSSSTELGGPHFSFSHDPSLKPPTSAGVSICSLSDALSRFSEISSKPAEGTPEEIVKTLLERNILCFAAMQGKCWTSSATSGVVPIKSNYITSVEQVTNLFAATYTENQAWRLMHPQEAGGYGNVFQSSNGQMYFQYQHLRTRNGDSFSTPTYAAIIDANDDEITFGRYYSSTPSGGAEPNNMHFKAIKENGEWRLDTYITDAPGFVQQYGSLIQTGRVGAPELMELAKEQVGNIGGRKYWEWYGFKQHIEWCAAFVSWCYNEAGKDKPFFTGCYSGAEWFMARGQWGGRDYADIAPGDAIFFDWNFDGSADHVGLVLGTDGENVYTIEGNRDDICITRGYSRANYQYIMGYGLMEW